jgi:hypothetical protein
MNSVSTPWHRASFDRFLQEGLAKLLAERLPLIGYQAEMGAPQTCCIQVMLSSANGDLEIVFDNLPAPDEQGVLLIDETPYVVVPLATEEALDRAEIHCIGEQLLDYIDERLDPVPPDLPWDAELARAWLALDLRIHAAGAGPAAGHDQLAQPADPPAPHPHPPARAGHRPRAVWTGLPL